MIWKSLVDKIEKIRQKPENIRMRFVWILTIASLILVLFIWFWSFSLGNKMPKGSFSFPSLISPDKSINMDKNKENIENAAEMIKDSLEKTQEEAEKIKNNGQQEFPATDNGQTSADLLPGQNDNMVGNSSPDMDGAVSSEQNSANAEDLLR